METPKPARKLVFSQGDAIWLLDTRTERTLGRAGLGWAPRPVETPWVDGAEGLQPCVHSCAHPQQGQPPHVGLHVCPVGPCRDRRYTHLPWSGVRCSMEDTFSRVLWSRSWASTLSSSTMERFMCQAKLPGRSISSTGIRQMPCVTDKASV